MPRSTSPMRGFTIYELTIVITLAALALSTVGNLLGSNTDLVQESRAHQRAEAEHRRNLVSLCEVFRTVDGQTLDGFNPAGVSTNPHFARVTGADLEERTYEGDEQLVWMPGPSAVSGIPNPGAIYLVRDGVRQLVADRIPQGGFYCRQQGQSILVHLTTYYLTSARRLVKTTSDAVVSMRN